MRTLFSHCLMSLFLLASLSACTEEPAPEKKVDRPVELDQYGNPVIYTADGEREVQDDGCD